MAWEVFENNGKWETREVSNDLIHNYNVFRTKQAADICCRDLNRIITD